MVEPSPTFFIVGAGAVGTAFASAISRAGLPVLGLHGRDPDRVIRSASSAGVIGSYGDWPEVLQAADVIVVAVGDTAIPEVAKQLSGRLRGSQTVLQTCGAHNAAEVLSLLAGRAGGIGTLHPFVSVTPGARAPFRGIAFGIEGERRAVYQACNLAYMLGGFALPVAAEKMALYHAAAVVASNYLVVLADQAHSLLQAAGVSREQSLPALIPLLASTVANLQRLGLPAALTGPVVRGDVVTVRRHLDALGPGAPRDLYIELGKGALALARERGVATAALEQLQNLLVDPGC